MPNDYISELKKSGQEITRQATLCEPEQILRLADLIGKNFAVQPHEVAILALATDERFLRFVVPETLRAIGQIPLSSTNSLAARTVREKRAEIINHFAVVPHASVFEAVPIPGELLRGDPIQKIMSMPIKLREKVVGVIQVSRKGQTAAEAGPDFTYPQLRELKTIADALAPCIPLCPNEWSTGDAANEKTENG
jgi:GAF domain